MDDKPMNSPKAGDWVKFVHDGQVVIDEVVAVWDDHYNSGSRLYVTQGHGVRRWPRDPSDGEWIEIRGMEVVDG